MDSDTARSDNDSTKNHAKRRRFSNPPAKSRPARRPLWLIAKQDNGRIEVYTIYSGSAVETLPIFSHEEEAEIFLWLGTLEAGWRARETTVGELVSLLYGPCTGVVEVALDPLPLFGDKAMAGLVSLPRRDFVRNLMDEHDFRAPCRGSFGSGARVKFRSFRKALRGGECEHT